MWLLPLPLLSFSSYWAEVGRGFDLFSGPPPGRAGIILGQGTTRERAMPPTPLRPALQAALSAARREAPRSDAELLAAFATRRDESAFAELVRRHGGLVLGVARRVAGDPGAAEDVFQATFLLLARKAPSARWGPTVGPWLYQAARRIGLRARARAARRRLLPLGPDVPAPADDPAAGLAWAEVRAALDGALASLPARLRDPLVLCYLQGL